MEFTYSKAIKCISCESQEVTTQYSPKGIGYCTCRVCNNKFVVEADGSRFIDSYLSERGRIFSELETAKLSGKNSVDVKRSLENLVQAYSIFADIDPIYFWYKIDILTDGFKDYSKYREAEKEFLNISKNNCFFVDREDIVRNEIYGKKYEKYKQEYLAREQAEKAKKHRKKKAVIFSVASIMFAVILGVGLFLGLYNPVLVDKETGISIRVDNSSVGIFGKFSVTPEITECEDTDATGVLSTVSSRFIAYDISLSKGGKSTSPKSEIEIAVPVPENYYSGNLCAYRFDGQTLNVIDGSLSRDGKIVFKTKNLGVFAITEVPYKVNFDGNGALFSQTEAVFYGENIKKPSDPTRRGYTFKGWYSDNAEYDFSKPVDKDLTLTAQWTANEYTITYLVNGRPVETQKAVFGDLLTLYKYEKPGYSISWYNGSDQITDGIWDIADNVTLEAKEVANNYGISLVNSLATCCPAVSAGDLSVTATYDGALPDIAIPSHTGYIFDGYYTEENGRGVKCYGADGKGEYVWNFTEVSSLYAHWTLDDKYSGYTYISTYSDLKNIGSGGKYLLVNDIDMNGNSWTPIASFSGTFDGGHHRIYNFKITNGIHENDLVYNFGLFASLNGTVKNLQIGKEDTTTSINHGEDYKRYNAGMIAGVCTGTIYNCRVIACTLYLKTFAQQDTYKGWEFYANVGGVCGNLSNGYLYKCQVEGTSVSSRVEVNYNSISAMSRAGGVAGFVNSSTLEDCIVRSCSITSYSKSNEGAWLNQSGKPHARSGCIVGTMVKWGSNNAVITRCVEASNSISANIEDKANKGGTSYAGAMIGESSSNTPSDLIGVNSGLSCSGTESNYRGFTRITQDSYKVLIETSSAFDNDYWVSNGGKISVDFYGN